jgi:hypothetical protein
MLNFMYKFPFPKSIPFYKIGIPSPATSFNDFGLGLNLKIRNYFIKTDIYNAIVQRSYLNILT